MSRVRMLSIVVEVENDDGSVSRFETVGRPLFGVQVELTPNYSEPDVPNGSIWYIPSTVESVDVTVSATLVGDEEGIIYRIVEVEPPAKLMLSERDG